MNNVPEIVSGAFLLLGYQAKNKIPRTMLPGVF
jgi:hypothetical protein